MSHKTSTRVAQVTGCLPLPFNHSWRIFVLISSALSLYSWTMLSTRAPDRVICQHNSAKCLVLYAYLLRDVNPLLLAREAEHLLQVGGVACCAIKEQCDLQLAKAIHSSQLSTIAREDFFEHSTKHWLCRLFSAAKNTSGLDHVICATFSVEMSNKAQCSV